MSSSFAYEDPTLRREMDAGRSVTHTQKAGAIFKEMGKGMWTTGKGFAKVGMLFSGIECVIESVRRSLPPLHLVFLSLLQYRAKNDIYNTIASGFVAGGVLARGSGPKAAMGGGLAFAAFSAAIDVAFLRRETPE